jgi:hypothetical protein
MMLSVGVPEDFQTAVRIKLNEQHVDLKRLSVIRLLSGAARKKIFWVVEAKNNSFQKIAVISEWEKRSGSFANSQKGIINVSCLFENVGEVQHFLYVILVCMRRGMCEVVGTDGLNKIEKSIKAQLETKLGKTVIYDCDPKMPIEVMVSYALKY